VSDNKKPNIYVMLSFDVDGETLWLSRDKINPVGPVMLSQGAYGPKVAVPKILNLLKKYDIKSTFFVPGWVAEHYGRTCDEILKNGHEIGHHGYMHEWPNRATPDEERESFQLGFEHLERVTGQRPVGYRSPGWEFSPITMELLIENNFLYSSNMMDSDEPYEHIINGKPTGLIELPVSWILDDAAFFMFGITTSGYVIQNARQVLEIWIDEFDGLYNEGEGKIYVLTMHPQIIGKASRLMMLEKLIDHIRGKSGVHFLNGMGAAMNFVSSHGYIELPRLF
jgi:peptidoglycan/xylan/chitin deacetylase (PgdA/CDA1 family)